MKVALAQIDTVVGDIAGNAAQIREAAVEARALGAALVVFPELALSGYLCRDHLDSAAFLDANERALEDLAAPADWNEGLALVVGFPERQEGPGQGVYNSAALIEGGDVRAIARKRLIPSYDVLDEKRYFEPGAASCVVRVGSTKVGITICEDAWNDESFHAHRRYVVDPVADCVAAGAELVVNLAASPFHRGKPAYRVGMFEHLARRHGVAVVTVNLIGGNDGVVFDGHSLAFAADGRLAAVCPGFERSITLFDPTAGLTAEPPASGDDADDDHALDAIVTGISGYFRKTGFTDTMLGVSGGMDSALVAALAAEALGPEHVHGYRLPTRYTSDASNADAVALAENLGMPLGVLEVEPTLKSALAVLTPEFDGKGPDVTEENLQARIRGFYLMALANKHGRLLLATGNKSEVAVGYATLYGDMCGAFAPISDVTKSRVYRLAARYNARKGRELIPQNIFDKAPSAELRENQTDQDSLPPYDVLDTVVEAYVEQRLDKAAIVELGVDAATVERVLKLIQRAEYKRWQLPPGPKVTPRPFGRDGWRMPLTDRWESWRG